MTTLSGRLAERNVDKKNILRQFLNNHTAHWVIDTS